MEKYGKKIVDFFFLLLFLASFEFSSLSIKLTVLVRLIGNKNGDKNLEKKGFREIVKKIYRKSEFQGKTSQKSFLKWNLHIERVTQEYFNYASPSWLSDWSAVDETSETFTDWLVLEMNRIRETFTTTTQRRSFKRIHKPCMHVCPSWSFRVFVLEKFLQDTWIFNHLQHFPCTNHFFLF